MITTKQASPIKQYEENKKFIYKITSQPHPGIEFVATRQAYLED